MDNYNARQSDFGSMFDAMNESTKPKTSKTDTPKSDDIMEAMLNVQETENISEDVATLDRETKAASDRMSAKVHDEEPEEEPEDEVEVEDAPEQDVEPEEEEEDEPEREPEATEEPEVQDTEPEPEQEAKPVQTDTPAFKAWFGDSKVITEKGKPLVVYHGGPEFISAFDEGHAGDTTADNEHGAFYFTSSEQIGQDYSIQSQIRRFDGRDEDELVQMGYSEEDAAQIIEDPEEYAYEHQQVVHAYMRMESPLVVDAKHTNLRDLENIFNIQDAIGYIKGKQVENVPEIVYEDLKYDPDLIEDNRDEIEEKAREDNDLEDDEEIEDYMFDEATREFMEENGYEEEVPSYDGLIIQNVQDDISEGSAFYGDVYIAITPRQIKSAKTNRGTFSTTSCRMLTMMSCWRV